MVCNSKIKSIFDVQLQWYALLAWFEKLPPAKKLQVVSHN